MAANNQTVVGLPVDKDGNYGFGPYVYNSFSGADITAQILVPNEPEPLQLGELSTLSYSIHRENKPVRILGRTNIRGFTRGSRTIAGSMIFTVFNVYAFYRLRQYQELVAGSSNNRTPMFPLADMLPPFDMIITYSNEYGIFSRMKLMGIVFVDEGGTMSIEDMITESQFTYMASGIQPITPFYPEEVKHISQYGVGTQSSERNTTLNSITMGTGR